MSKKKGRALPANGSGYDGKDFDDWWDRKKTKSEKDSKWSYGTGESCHKSHPPLVLPGTELVIHGGSCISPVVKDADVYVGFSFGMAKTRRRFPWVAGTEIEFEIPDQGIPRSPADFKDLVLWVQEMLVDGWRVHCGCVGGHGRTGMFLAALVSTFGEDDPVAYVREHYCRKAVESRAQVEFLVKQWNCKTAEPRHSHLSSTSTTSSKSSSLGLLSGKTFNGSTLPGGAPTIVKSLGRGSIWGDAVQLTARG